LTEAKVLQAMASLREAFGDVGIEGQDFVDLGSGSGLFSYAAHRMGARVVTSIDVDPNSIACTAALRTRGGDPSTWTIVQGSVLDPDFVGKLAPASRLYSWGVLHHTGAMWVAFDAALSLLAPGGLACIALYNRPRRPRLHLGLKRTYNRLPHLLQPLMAGLYASAYFAKLLVRGQNPIAFVRGYGASSRGMSFWRDVEDWLGGLPYEFAEPEEVEAHVRRLGLGVVRVLVRSPGNNNEYLISRPRADHAATRP
jgi:SAM-dependent methyltransferase